MAYSFDTLGYAKHLEDAGIERMHAEAHATAARGFIMAELVTKADLQNGLETQALKLTVRFGTMLGGAVAAIGILIRVLGAH